ncbi:putative transcription factor OFP family [Helianthus anomalus]
MFDIKISLSSLRLCRRKTKSPATTHFFSPFNPKTVEIAYPTTPSPPPTTPIYPPHLTKCSDEPGFSFSDESGGVCHEVMKETLTVVRWSEHPLDDFKVSMLEMILEKQMFEAKDLEQLLQCFLALNSRNHHADIVAAFTEIWEILYR